MGDPPLERTATEPKVGVRHFFTWWYRARLQKQVQKALDSSIEAPPPPRPLLEGPGVIVLPSDPILSALSAMAISEFCKFLPQPVRLAGPPSSLRWIPESESTGSHILTPDAQVSPRAFAEWLEYNRSNRGEWSLLATVASTPVEEAVFHWLGMGARIAAPRSCPRGSANVILSTPSIATCLDANLRSLIRILRPQMGELTFPPHAPGGPVVIELPDDLPEKGRRNRLWADAITQIATTNPLQVAQFDPLPSSITELLRGLGSRVSVAHIANARETLQLAEKARIWIGPRSPTTALAALTNCRVKLIGNSKAAADYPETSALTISGKIGWQAELDSL